MTITRENIEQSYQIEQKTTDMLSVMLRQNLTVSQKDNEKTIARKIDTLNSLKEYFLKNIDIDSLPTDKDQLNFMDLISNITEQIQVYEIMIGRKDLEHLRRIGRRFGQKHQM